MGLFVLAAPNAQPAEKIKAAIGNLEIWLNNQNSDHLLQFASIYIDEVLDETGVKAVSYDEPTDTFTFSDGRTERGKYYTSEMYHKLLAQVERHKGTQTLETRDP